MIKNATFNQINQNLIDLLCHLTALVFYIFEITRQLTDDRNFKYTWLAVSYMWGNRKMKPHLNLCQLL